MLNVNSDCQSSNDEAIVIRAPGKIILSGEHAVVHGCPALAMAVNRFCQVDLTQSTGNYVSFNLPNYDWQQTFTTENLLALQQRLETQYKEFLKGKYPNVDSLMAPTELAIYACIFFATQLMADLGNILKGLNITITSDIPIGCGMGSSAALIVALGYALQEYTARKVTDEIFLAWSKVIENLQHGHSSGVDLYLAYYGGAILFTYDGKVEKRNIPKIPLQLINTGAAQSSTGECVISVEKFLEKSGMADDFTNITLAMDRALQENDYKTVQECVRENNKLLCYIGVVPARVREFIMALEQRGVAAKISGAGAVYGDGAGIALLVGDDNVDDLLIKYGYSKLSISGEERGVKKR